ncbi:MAG: TVP38/TMEM64 family protein [Coprobacillus cateniformis]|uniref:TVP38/TMEM64 family protein n=1 Tax=Longibaculum muris TaxID=1796628 RepID=UPI003AB7C49C|nr:TVP38/TMEM64 family protein [Coprobacillus cateniformis]
MKFLKQHQKAIKGIGLCFLIMTIACLLLYKPMMSLFHDPQLLRHQLQELGILGYFIMSLLMALQVVFVFLPGEIIEIMSGYLYGPIGGMIACLIGSAIGSSLIYVFVKKFGLSFIQRFIDTKKIEEVSFLKNKEKRNMLCFLIFFIPGTPKDALTYFIPLTDMKLSTFLFITTIARIPSIITSTIGGHAIGVENYIFSIFVFVITGVISLVGLYVYKKISQKKVMNYNL